MHKRYEQHWHKQQIEPDVICLRPLTEAIASSASGSARHLLLLGMVYQTILGNS